MFESPTYIVKYESFSGSKSLDALFVKAAEFASRIGPERVMNISHSMSMDTGVVTVWYRTEAESADRA